MTGQYRLYLHSPGGLDASSVRDYFSKFGEVTDVYIPKGFDGSGRDYGFVTCDTEEALLAALAAGEMHLVDGRLVRINRAGPRPAHHGQGPGRSPGSRHLGAAALAGTYAPIGLPLQPQAFVPGMLPPQPQPQGYQQAPLMASAGYGYDMPAGTGFIGGGADQLTYAGQQQLYNAAAAAGTADDMNLMLSGLYLDPQGKGTSPTPRDGLSGWSAFSAGLNPGGPSGDGNPSGSDGEGGLSDSPLPKGSGPRIYVGGVPNTVSESMIRKHFTRWGRVEDVYFPKNRPTGRRRPFCFVTFNSMRAAEKAVAQSNREISGHPIESISLTADRSQHYMQRELMTGASPGSGLPGSVGQPLSMEQQPQQQPPSQLPASSRDYSHFGGDVSHLAAQQSSPFDRRTTPPGQQGDSGSSSTNTAWQGQRSSQMGYGDLSSSPSGEGSCQMNFDGSLPQRQPSFGGQQPQQQQQQSQQQGGSSPKISHSGSGLRLRDVVGQMAEDVARRTSSKQHPQGWPISSSSGNNASIDHFMPGAGQGPAPAMGAPAQDMRRNSNSFTSVPTTQSNSWSSSEGGAGYPPPSYF